MNKSRNALRASIGLAAVALSLSLVSFVSAAHVTPIQIAGNQTCSDLVPGTTELKVDPVEDGTFTDGTLTVTIDVRDTDDGPVSDWTSNIGVDAVFAKGGKGGNLYIYDPESTGDTGLHAPLNPSGLWAGLSHISFCYDVEPPTPSPSPS